MIETVRLPMGLPAWSLSLSACRCIGSSCGFCTVSSATWTLAQPSSVPAELDGGGRYDRLSVLVNVWTARRPAGLARLPEDGARLAPTEGGVVGATILVGA